MLEFLRRWVKDAPRQGPNREEEETFGHVSLPRTLGWAIVNGAPWRREMLGKIRALFTALPEGEKGDLIDRVLVRFALYVGDLGASENNHHSGSCGLYEHSLEAAYEALVMLSSAKFRVSEDPAVEFHERPLWLYAGFVLATLHDLGKVFDLDLFSPDEQELWNPIEEPLLGFLARHDLAETKPRMKKYHKGRDQERHAWLGLLLVPAVLPFGSARHLGPRLAQLMDGYVRSVSFRIERCLRGPAGEVVEMVRHVDRLLSERDVSKKTCAKRKDGSREAEPKDSKSEGEKNATAAEKPEAPASATPQPAEAARSAPPPAGESRASLFDYFSNALRLALENGRVSANTVGAAMFVGKTYFYLRYAAGLDLVANIMVERWAEEDDRVKGLAASDSPAYALLRVLEGEGRLFRFAEDKAVRFQAKILHGAGETDDAEVVLVRKEGTRVTFAPFEGTIALRSPLKAESVRVDDLDPGEFLEEPPKGAAQEGAPAESKPAEGKPPSRGRDSPASREIQAKLDPTLLMAALREGIWGSQISRNTPRALAFVGKTHTWLLHPEGFAQLARQLNIRLETGLVRQILEAMRKLPQVEPKDLIHARVSPDAKKTVALLRLRNEELFSEADLALLGTWRYEIMPSSSTPAPSGNGRGGTPPPNPERLPS